MAADVPKSSSFATFFLNLASSLLLPAPLWLVPFPPSAVSTSVVILVTGNPNPFWLFLNNFSFFGFVYFNDTHPKIHHPLPVLPIFCSDPAHLTWLSVGFYSYRGGQSPSTFKFKKPPGDPHHPQMHLSLLTKPPPLKTFYLITKKVGNHTQWSLNAHPFFKFFLTVPISTTQRNLEPASLGAQSFKIMPLHFFCQPSTFCEITTWQKIFSVCFIISFPRFCVCSLHKPIDS